MSREFSLVLIGSGILTAGYFASPALDAEAEEKAVAQAEQRTGNPHGTYRSGGMFLFIHSPAYSGGAGMNRPAAYSPSARAGGFGSGGRSFGGGGG